MSDWTPGPWTVEGIWEDGFRARNKETEPADLWTVEPVMYAGGYDGLWHGGVEREADARLIAAAPEMADELGNLVGYCDNCGGSGYVDQANESSCRWCSPARALLSRIRGEA